MGCPPVRGDNPRTLASGLSYVQVDKHGITILYTYISDKFVFTYLHVCYIPLLLSQHAVVCQHWSASETLFKRRFAGGLTMATFNFILGGLL